MPVQAIAGLTGLHVPEPDDSVFASGYEETSTANLDRTQIRERPSAGGILLEQVARHGIPEPDGAVVAGRCEYRAGGGPDCVQRGDPSAVGPQHSQRRAGQRIPEPD